MGRGVKHVLDAAVLDLVSERIRNVNPDDRFLEMFIPLLEREMQDSDRNKKYYFRTEYAILLLSALSGFIGVLSTGQLFLDKIEVALGVLASLISFTITCLIGIRALRQRRETWLRHRNCLNACCMECYRYANRTEPYPEYIIDVKDEGQQVNEERRKHELEQLQKFKSRLLDLFAQNSQRFLDNMSEKRV